MKKLCWVGDAAVSTGFARATHYILDVLKHSWDIRVLGINYLGDPHPYKDLQNRIYPAIAGGDAFGVGRIAQMAKVFDFDCIVLQNDVWNIPDYMYELKKANITTPVVGFLAVDGKNCQGWKLNDLALAIFWTRFAEQEARKGGYTGRSVVVPLGVDLDIYKPMAQAVARAMLSVPPTAKARPGADSFIVLNVNRNQQRKRLDLTCEYFCAWVEQYKIDDAFLMFHACPTNDDEYDIEQLMDYYGYRDRLILFRPNVGNGVSEAQLVVEYAMSDVLMTTTQGEGFGLTTFEGMACGIPCIVPDWAALGELTYNAALQIPCTTFAATQRNINVIGGIADKDLFVNALQLMYQSQTLRDHYRQSGLQRVNEPQYRWQSVGESFNAALNLL